jgi:CHAD domain-containing protein
LEALLPEQCELLERYRMKLVQTGDAESAHKLRVTTRRLQAAIDLLPPLSRLWTMVAKNTLRRWRESLSRVRNYDVFKSLLDSREFSNLPGGSRLSLLKSAFAERRARGLAHARITLAEPFRAELVTPGYPTARKAGSRMDQDDDLAIELLEHSLLQLGSLAASVQTADTKQAHALRIEVKRSRYLLELFCRAGYGDFAPALEWLTALQDRLGNWRDLALLETEIIKTVSRHDFLKEHLADCSAILEFAGGLRERRRSLEREILPVSISPLLDSTIRQVTEACSARQPPSVRAARTA